MFEDSRFIRHYKLPKTFLRISVTLAIGSFLILSSSSWTSWNNPSIALLVIYSFKSVLISCEPVKKEAELYAEVSGSQYLVKLTLFIAFSTFGENAAISLDEVFYFK